MSSTNFSMIIIINKNVTLITSQNLEYTWRQIFTTHVELWRADLTFILLFHFKWENILDDLLITVFVLKVFFYLSFKLFYCSLVDRKQWIRLVKINIIAVLHFILIIFYSVNSTDIISLKIITETTSIIFKIKKWEKCCFLLQLK